MSPEDRAVLSELVRGQTKLVCSMRDLAGALSKQAANNAVLLTAAGALFAEIARVSNRPGELDRMLERLTAVIETQVDQNADILKATDRIRAYAEGLAPV